MSRILIVDDHALVREAMAQSLARLQPGLVCVEASSADQALSCLERDAELDLAVIDRDVFHWLINHDRQLQVAGLQFHPRILEHKSLHIMFHPDQQALQQRVAQAIARLDIVQLSEDYQRRYLQSPPAP